MVDGLKMIEVGMVTLPLGDYNKLVKAEMTLEQIKKTYDADCIKGTTWKFEEQLLNITGWEKLSEKKDEG